MDMKEFNLLGIIALVGAIIMVVGVFLDWITVDFGLGQRGLSGWNMSTDPISPDWVDYHYAPLICLICGVFQLVAMILPTFMNSERFAKINDILGLVALIIAILGIVFTALYQFQKFPGEGVAKVGIGCWLCLAGAIITAIGGLAPIIKNKFMSRN